MEAQWGIEWPILDINNSVAAAVPHSQPHPFEMGQFSKPHESTSSATKEKRFQCPELNCGRWFAQKSHYEFHVRQHTGEKPFVCPECGKAFSQQGRLNWHMKVHPGEMRVKPFPCEDCGKSFDDAAHLREHLKRHSDERPFICEVCDRGFTEASNLKKHMDTHSGEKPFPCEHCGERFARKWSLERHVKTHGKEQPFACDQCTRTFRHWRDLKWHMPIHAGKTPFQCSDCAMPFKQKHYFDRHMKNVHNIVKEVDDNSVSTESSSTEKSSKKVGSSKKKRSQSSSTEESSLGEYNGEEIPDDIIVKVSPPNTPEYFSEECLPEDMDEACDNVEIKLEIDDNGETPKTEDNEGSYSLLETLAAEALENLKGINPDNKDYGSIIAATKAVEKIAEEVRRLRL